MRKKYFLYEARPYAYGALAIYALLISRTNMIMNISGAVMAICCILVTAMRYQYRKDLDQMQVAHNRSHPQMPDKSYHGQNKYTIE